MLLFKLSHIVLELNRHFSNLERVLAAGAAVDHLGNPEAEDEGRVARDSAVIAETKSIIDELGWPIAERGQFAPRVEAEYGGRDDAGQVEAAAAGHANASRGTDYRGPSAEKHPPRVDGKDDHRKCRKRVHCAEVVACIPAWIALFV